MVVRMELLRGVMKRACTVIEVIGADREFSTGTQLCFEAFIEDAVEIDIYIAAVVNEHFLGILQIDVSFTRPLTLVPISCAECFA